MRDSKKTLITAALFLLFLLIYSFILIRPYEDSTFASENDRGLRDDLAGKIDVIITGASHAQYGVIPSVLDGELGCFSYNLSGPWQNLYGTRLLLEKELDRNPVKKVYMTISEDTFWAEKDTDDLVGDVKILPRLDGLSERMDYLAHGTAPKELPGVYQDMLNRGFTYWIRLILGDETDNVDREARGFFARESINIKLTKKRAAKIKDRDKINATVKALNKERLIDIVALCRERGIDIQMIVVPVSDRVIWQTDGWDDWYVIAKEFCKEQNVTLWDFNLYRGRYELFSDTVSFTNWTHMSGEGAEAFSDLLAATIKKDAAGEDISGDFYSTYAEMKEDSPYNKKK